MFFFIVPRNNHSSENTDVTEQSRKNPSTDSPSKGTSHSPESNQEGESSSQARDQAKRKLEFGEESGSVPKKSHQDQQPTSTVGGSSQQERTIGTSTNISAKVTSERTGGQLEQDPDPGEVDQQVPTAAGNDLNERGSIVGESGNKKVQKAAYKFGVLKVSNMSKTFLIAYSSVEFAEAFNTILNIHYGHTKIQSCGMRTTLKDDKGFEHTYFWILVKLGFNISFNSLKQKFGNSITRSKYFLVRNISDDINEMSEDALNELKSNIQLLYINNAGFSTFDELLEQETKRFEYKEAEKTNKKRKLTFN